MYHFERMYDMRTERKVFIIVKKQGALMDLLECKMPEIRVKYR